MPTDDAFEQILSLPATWKIERMVFRHEVEEAHVWLRERPTALRCPECGEECPIHDHASEQVWRHLDLWRYQTFIHAEVPRVRCPKHGVRQCRVPWADPRQNLTKEMERHVIGEVLACQTVSGAGRRVRMGWDQVHRVMTRSVERGLTRRTNADLRYVAVDEKALLKGQSYVTLIYNLTGSHVIDVVEGRTIDSLKGFWKSMKYEVRDSIQGIAMDMWPAYITATKACVPNADDKIVHDRFHVAQHMGKAVDDTRIDEHRRLKQAGDQSLSGTKHWWLYGQENLPKKLVSELATLVATDLQTAKAWTIKEHLRHLWDMPTVESAKTFARSWAAKAKDTGLKPVIKVANLVLNHIDQIANYANHKITTGKAEGINSVVMTIKRAARGYRTWASFRTAILFFCGGLDLYPHPD